MNPEIFLFGRSVIMRHLLIIKIVNLGTIYLILLYPDIFLQILQVFITTKWFMHKIQADTH